LIATQGNTIKDKMYHVNEKGAERKGMELVNSMENMEKMLRKFE
jgi:ferredoxin-thioredoxin reductase catalytic subunit